MKDTIKPYIKKIIKKYEEITTKSLKYENLSRNILLRCKHHIVKVTLNNQTYFFYVSIKDINKPTVVFSNAAYNMDQSTPPFFMRKSWNKELDYNCIYIDDLTVHNNELNVGWGIGNKTHHFLKDYSSIIKKITRELNISDEKVFYFGSSAGGYMSIQLATLHSNSTAIVNNPQTDVFRYYPNTIKKLCDTIFPQADSYEIYEKYKERLSLVESFRINDNIPRIFLLQNSKCKNDMEMHMEPFITEIKDMKNKNNIKFLFYNRKNDGHNSLEKETTLNIVNLIIDRKIDELSKYINNNINDKD
ncbi:alpha/beta hydrolase family protein [Macrococcoides canis]|uniref:alpha/beta hydrolase family protein n=1 Tax=Macrococcoides canis TaxID=1855823 RepID=UPI00105DA3DF|nr:prolyl oligopeptidase family serine peptidase [Macrococcus canis]TDM34381.1 glycosyl transferase [Macrococcus canis]